jgi:hypothetical protein
VRAWIRGGAGRRSFRSVCRGEGAVFASREISWALAIAYHGVWEWRLVYRGKGPSRKSEPVRYYMFHLVGNVALSTSRLRLSTPMTIQVA